MMRTLFRLAPLALILATTSAAAQSIDGPAGTAPPAFSSDASGSIANTDENRMKLARQLIDVQSTEMKRSMNQMVDSFEQSMPPEFREQFRAAFGKVFDFDQAQQYSAMVMAKDLSADELSALITFYSSPVGHSAMTKMPQVMQDTLPFMRAVMEQAMRQLPSHLRPPQFRDL